MRIPFLSRLMEIKEKQLDLEAQQTAYLVMIREILSQNLMIAEIMKLNLIKSKRRCKK